MAKWVHVLEEIILPAGNKLKPGRGFRTNTPEKFIMRYGDKIEINDLHPAQQRKAKIQQATTAKPRRTRKKKDSENIDNQ